MATEQMDQSWWKLRDRIKESWPDEEFDNKNMKKTRGSLREMVSLIQEKTGESREQIRQKIVGMM